MDIRLFLKRPKAANPTVIFARINYEGGQLKYYLPEKVNPTHWNQKLQRAKQTDKFKEHPEFNRRLENIITDIGNIIRTYINENGNPPNPETLKELLDIEIFKKPKTPAQTFFSVLEAIIRDSETGVRMHHKTGKPLSYHTIKTYKTVIEHLRAYNKTKKRKVDFDNIDLDFYNDYKEYLITNPKLASNTIGKHIQIIKLVMNEATDRGINKNLSYKSKRFVTITEKTDSIYLTEAEIKKLEKLDLSKSKKLDRVRDMFLVGCYTGLRFSDFSILKPENIQDGFIEKKQQKTGYPVMIPIHPTVKRIIDKYDSNLKAISNQKMNEYLKELGENAEINSTVHKTITKGGKTLHFSFKKYDLLTTHTARRSFATNEYLAGTPTITIMAITGHRTESAFMKYIKLTPTEHAKILKMHWQKRFAENNLKAV